MLCDGCGSPDQEIKKVLTVDIINRSTFSAGIILLVAVESWLSPWPVSQCCAGDPEDRPEGWI